MKWVIIVVAVAAAGCDRASDAGSAKRMPKPPPPQELNVPQDLSIAVEIDGQPAQAIDAARLGAVQPDYADGERRAWKFTTLLGAAASRPGVAIEATGARGASVVLRPTHGAKDPLPVLMISRRGDVLAIMIEPDDPFPQFHGQGGRLGRPGDPLPRISQVSKVRVYVQAP